MSLSFSVRHPKIAVRLFIWFVLIAVTPIIGVLLMTSVANESTLRLAVAILSCGLLAVVALAAFLASRSISKPIERLIEHVNLVADGKLSQTIDVISKDEIGELGEAFNRMTAELEQANAAAEARVRSRTQELNETTALMRVLEEIASAANEAPSIDDAMRTALEQFGIALSGSTA